MVHRLGILSITVMVIVGASCSSVPKEIYADKGLGFKITPNFRIGRASTYKKNQSTYIPIYIRDKDVYAKFSVVWVPCLSDLDWEIQNYVDGLNSIYESDTQNKPEYGEVRTVKFGSNTAKQIEYVVPNDGPRVGSYTVFHCDGLTVIIGQHSTVEGQAAIQKCREVIEATYFCKSNQVQK